MPDAFWNLDVSFGDAALRLAAAIVLGGAVGWERETLKRPAGLRTHVLVALGSAVFALMGVEFMLSSGADAADPMRIIEAVATGVGFLGAGAILHSGGHVKGLTTAASVWVVAGVGVAAGMGLFGLGVLVTLLALLTLRVLLWFEPKG